jgi:hypothetical protein
LSKERTEEYVLGTIEQNVLSSAVATRFHELIDRYLDSYLSDNGTASQEVEAALKSNATKLDNLLSLIEKGISTDTILPRVKELEAEKVRLEWEWQRVQHLGADQRAVKSAAEQAESFMASFSDKWRKASILDRKGVIRRVVKGITVDRANGDFTSTFYRLPKVNNPIVTAILQNFGSGVHSKVCPEQDPGRTPAEGFGTNGTVPQLELESVVGTLGTKMPPRKTGGIFVPSARNRVHI